MAPNISQCIPNSNTYLLIQFLSYTTNLHSGVELQDYKRTDWLSEAQIRIVFIIKICFTRWPNSLSISWCCSSLFGLPPNEKIFIMFRQMKIIVWWLLCCSRHIRERIFFFNTRGFSIALTVHLQVSFHPWTDLDQNQIFHLQWTEREKEKTFDT